MRWNQAPDEWQAFLARWRSTTAHPPLANSDTPTLSLGHLNVSELPRDFPSTIFVRKSYIQMFHRIWLCALALPGTKRGVVITGQPGTGMYSITYIVMQGY